MKKIIVLVLSLVLAMVCLTGCGDKVSKVTISTSTAICGSNEIHEHETTYYKVNGEKMSEEEYLEWKDSKGIWG